MGQTCETPKFVKKFPINGEG